MVKQPVSKVVNRAPPSTFLPYSLHLLVHNFPLNFQAAHWEFCSNFYTPKIFNKVLPVTTAAFVYLQSSWSASCESRKLRATVLCVKIPFLSKYPFTKLLQAYQKSVVSNIKCCKQEKADIDYFYSALYVISAAESIIMLQSWVVN